MRCDHCGADGPAGGYCARCGAHHASAVPTTRIDSFAAHPGEHVGLPAIFSTLLPQAAHEHASPFRVLLISGVAVVAALWATGVVGVAFAVAAVLVPGLYLFFLRRAEIYEREPLRSIGIAFAGGLALGTAITAPAQRLIDATGEVTVGALLALVIAVPLISEAVKPLPALALRGRPGHGDTVDGLTLGIASGLGFALAETAITFVPVIRTLELRVDPSHWFVPLLGAALLVPLMQAGCAGLLTASLWRAFRGRSGPLERAGLVIAPTAHVLFAGVTHVATSSWPGDLAVLAAQGIIVVLLLVCVRTLLHSALLDEAAGLGLADIDCGHCHRHLVAAAFCPGCGAAVPSASRRGTATARAGRPVAGS